MEAPEPHPSEYKEVLHFVLAALTYATKDKRLPDLTPEQAHYWLTNLSQDDVSESFRVIQKEPFLKILAPFIALGGICPSCGKKVA